ncbi:tetratricopeptide repeat domain protein [Dissulfurispira thermophila]|uniref:Tetratricopeptide repeat domain protein n=2 Tax=root TaxID=1 RepID=A0A7G1GZX5_9BACT|nr:GNA1162 family protein [Dissulfurispira thermophila]BCB96065.1 tetratricopeptide repeat domain protein [Dissulfurispira thermophila]
MKIRKMAIILFALLFLFSCAQPSEVKKDIPEITVSEEELPRMVAVLPFQNETQEPGIANQVRRAFYNHFSSKPYADVELNVVDEKIIQLEKSTGKNILDLKPQDISQSIGCDGLIYGKVTDYKKVYAAVYSQLGVEAEVWMINTKTGKEVFRIKDSVRYHEGGIPMSPLSVIMTAVSTAMNIRDIQQMRMINELAYKFNEKIPSPTGVAIEERPIIKEVLTNIKEGPFGKGKIIRVGLEGDKGMVATFDIGNFKKGIPMKETKPGIYMGEYLVMPGDNAKDMPIIASLKKPGGYESQWIDVGGFLTIDTTPPPQVTGLRAKGFHDRIEVSWEGVKNVSDLKGYKVLRSEQPLSGYSEIGSVELNSFEDRTAIHGNAYYYRVVAFDSAGNESEIQDAVRASLMTKEPVVLAGEIKKDTVLSGVYIVKDTFTIPKGLSLTIEPETRLMFDENASLAVFGKIIVNGKESPVEFISSGEKKWKGIVVDGGSIMMNGFRIKNADVGLSAKNSEGLMESGVITDSNTGMSISGTPSVNVKNIAASGNKTGIELIKTDAKIFMSSVFQNETGVAINSFSGDMKDNNIFDNSLNISSESMVKIDPNYLGSINIDEMKIKGVSINKVYDNRIPGGKIVDAVSNPYANLSQENRQKKAMEFVIEAGNYFRQRNYGKASSLFEEALKAYPTADVYYYLALCYQEMKEDEKALKYLKEGAEKFPRDSTLQKSLGLMYYQKGNEAEAKKVFEEVLRLSPEDRQVRFLIERIGK